MLFVVWGSASFQWRGLPGGTRATGYMPSQNSSQLSAPPVCGALGVIGLSGRAHQDW